MSDAKKKHLWLSLILHKMIVIDLLGDFFRLMGLKPSKEVMM